MANSMLRETTDKLRESAGQVGEKASAMAHVARDTATDLSHRAHESLGTIKEAASGYIEEGRDRVKALGRTVGGQVQEWPLPALIVAAGVGLLIGVVLARRYSR